MGAWRWFAAVLACLGMAGAFAADGIELSAKSRLSAARIEPADTPVRSTQSFLPSDPAVERALHDDAPARTTPRSGCHLSDLCYDAAAGHMLTYRGARRFMPPIDGLSPEGVSVRRDRLVLRYSFR